MNYYQQDFSDEKLWNEELTKYVTNNACSIGNDREIWNYFKYCLQTQNRFFFQNPLIPIIIERFKQNAIGVSSGTALYRARIDSERKHEEMCWRYKDFLEMERIIIEQEYYHPLDYALHAEEIGYANALSHDPDFNEFLKRKSKGFEGFDANESGVPPYTKVSSGRCNPEKVVFLYAADNAHTAVAEVRPYIWDAISVATLIVKKNIKLVDFYFEYDEKGHIIIEDQFYHNMQTDFSRLNKGNKDDYLITQYLALLAQNNGFDGIRFRSSLVKQGSNYVIFDSSNCEIVSSKMYVIPEVKYSLNAILDEA